MTYRIAGVPQEIRNPSLDPRATGRRCTSIWWVERDGRLEATAPDSVQSFPLRCDVQRSTIAAAIRSASAQVVV